MAYMKKNKPLSVAIVTAITIAIFLPNKGCSQVEEKKAYSIFDLGYYQQMLEDAANGAKQKLQELAAKVTSTTSELFNIKLLDRSVLDIFDTDLVDEVFSTTTKDVEYRMKELVAIWASKGQFISPSAQLGIVKNAKGQSVILDLAEEDLTFVENQILDILIRLRGEGKLVSFMSTLIEKLKTDSHFGPMVMSINPDEKLKLLSTIDSTIASTGSLRKFTKESWTELSAKLADKLNSSEQNKQSQTRLSDGNFFSELADIANTNFRSTQNVRLLVNGPASFALRDSAMANAKESINMITWAVLDDKTGTELADLLIAKAKKIKVRLIVDGQVSYQIGYKDQISRMEKNGVSVIRWMNPSAAFMGQHRKILIVDEALTIMGGMNPGDTYSHKAGEPKNLWRDTDVAIEGEAVAQTQQLFATLWNRQVVDQKLSLEKVMVLKKPSTVKADGRAMIIEHQPSGAADQHEVLLATMKAIRGAEKTVDIENAYVIVFPSLLNEIKAAVDRGVRVRVLTNSSDSVDEPVVALPITRSAKKLADIGAEVYLRKGSTIHSKYMVVDDRLLLIGSYNYHPRSERVEGETIALFDHARLAEQATKAFENDISPEHATALDKSVELNLPVNGSTLLPLRMFYDQL